MTCARFAQVIEAHPEGWEPVRSHIEDWRRQAKALRASVEAMGDVDVDARRDAGRITAVIGDWRVTTRVGVVFGETEGAWIDLTHLPSLASITMQASEAEERAALRAGGEDLARVLQDGARNWLAS